MTSAEAANPVRTTQTSVEILRCVADSGGATLMELNDRVSVSKGALYNHLSTLVELELLERVDGTYRVDVGVLALGEQARMAIPGFPAIRGTLRNLAMTSGEFATFVKTRDGTPIVAETAAGELVERHWLSVGQELPLATTAAGKVVLATLPEERAAALVREQTSHETESLLEEIRTVRVQGLAFSRGEFQDDQYSVAAPIDSSDGPTYVVSLTGPKDRLDGKSLQQDIAGLVVSASNEIQRHILS
ncbi:IclR family transcriptional regulator [Haloparvum sedimenti]|uniref:IclR family transcriptional regulator n=1 Tax=Haloparvum sedimenti TaxID=1678448 RepID=UPI00071E9875|nr:IclR family transcriptional regulator C-terminal domain-containing protein [Haloparvum sedimenti]